jgi:uncharacterized protein (TIGR02588 family)
MPPRETRKIPPIEWITGIISALMVLGTLGYLAFDAVQVTADEPMLSAHVLQVRTVGPTFVVDVEIRNQSRAPAAEVQIAGMARAPDGKERDARAAIDYVPGFSTRRVSLVFDVDPGQRPDARIVGYSRP